MFLLAAVGFGSIACGDDDPKKPGDGGGVTPGDYDITVDAKSVVGDYYIRSIVEDKSTEFFMLLSDVTLTGEAYDPTIGGAGTVVGLDLFAITSTAKKGILPNGTYKFITAETMPTSKTCSAANTLIFTTDASGKPIAESGREVKSGTVVVASEGSTYTITVDFKLDNKETLLCTYKGEITFSEQDYIHTTLTADYTVPMTGLPGTVSYFGDAYDVGADVWMIEMLTPQVDNSEGMIFEVACPMGEFADGLPVGTYTVDGSDTYEPGTYVCAPGWLTLENGLAATWYVGGFTPDGVTKMAPAMSGTLTVSKEAAVYTVTFEFKDDAKTPNTFKGTWTGTPAMTDKREKSSNTRAENSFKAVRANKVCTLL